MGNKISLPFKLLSKGLKRGFKLVIYYFSLFFNQDEIRFCPTGLFLCRQPLELGCYQFGFGFKNKRLVFMRFARLLGLKNRIVYISSLVSLGVNLSKCANFSESPSVVGVPKLLNDKSSVSCYFLLIKKLSFLLH